MHRARFILPLLLVFAAPALAADPPATKFPDWPVLPSIPQPMPPRPAGDVVAFGKDVLYVVQGDGNDQLLSSPPGLVQITELVGPTSVYGRFVDGSGKSELRNYDKKQVFVVERLAAGQVELIKVPKGKVERRVLGDGTDPIPPPKPDDKKDDVNPPEPAKTFRVIFVKESGKSRSATPGQQSVMEGVKVEEYLNKNATGGKAGWKRRDPDQPAEPGVMGELWTEAKKLLKPTDPPCVVVEKNGKFEIIKVEETPEAMIAVFDRYLKGGK